MVRRAPSNDLKPCLALMRRFEGSMVLLDDIVQVRREPAPAAPTETPLLLQPRHRLGYDRLPSTLMTRGNDPRARIIHRRQDLIEESLGSCYIPILRETE